jgi:hypothetical protein
MQRMLYKSCWITLLLLAGCNCGNSDGSEKDNKDNLEPLQQQKYYNLKAIDLAIEAKGEFSFVYNNQQLTKEGDIYLSEDLLVYRTQDGKWRATVIGKGGISSHLKISAGQGLLQEVEISTTNEVVGYRDEVGKEWPGMYNIGNTCFANAMYKLIARCSGFDQVLSKDIEGGIHTALRNIVNGIRLGHKSALQEEVVNRKISALFLDKLEENGLRRFNDRTQQDSQLFLMEILRLLYPNRPINNDAVKALLDIPKLDNPVGYIAKLEGDPLYNHGADEWVSGCLLVKPPLFYIEVISERAETDIATPQNLVKSYYDYKTEKKLGEKKYKLIALVHRIGSSMSSGHYVAYINHGQEWYLQNDSQVNQAPALNSVRTLKWIGLYEPDDQLQG